MPRSKNHRHPVGQISSVEKSKRICAEIQHDKEEWKEKQRQAEEEIRQLKEQHQRGRRSTEEERGDTATESKGFEKKGKLPLARHKYVQLVQTIKNPMSQEISQEIFWLN